MLTRNLHNYATIDFTRDECEAIAELRTFVQELAYEQQKNVGDHRKLNQLRLSLKRAVEACARVAGPGGFINVEVTKDECDAVCECAEFLESLFQANQMPGFGSRRSENFRLALRRARMKCSVAAEVIKPNITTDLRLV